MKIPNNTNGQVRVARLTMGLAWPVDLPWPPGEHTLVMISPFPPSRCSVSEVALSGRSIDSDEVVPLVRRQNGEFAPTFDIHSWRRAMIAESYRPEHTTPIMARLPFHYHRLPGFVRNVLATVMLSFGETRGFPAGLRDCGPLILCALLADVREDSPPVAVLTHDIDTVHGLGWVDAIAAAEEEIGARACWNVVPRHYSIDEAKLAGLAAAGHEIGLHGIWHTNSEAFLAPEKLAHEFELLADFRTRFGIRAYRGPSWYRTQAMFDVLADYFDADLTTLDIDLVCPGGRGGVGLTRPFRVRPTLVEIPCTLPFEAPLIVGPRPQSLVEFWRPKIDMLKRAGGMAVVNTHPDPNYLGNDKILAEYCGLLALLSDTGWTFRLPREVVAS
jgi:peptidoglycan/xylan/chitin deacetylase (PgdA/CDA1 family)